MKKFLLMASSALIFSLSASAEQSSISDPSQITAAKISEMCSKMKPARYSENEEGKVIRKGCNFKDGVYTIIYQVSGKNEYLKSLEESGIRNQNARNGDPEEFKKYCTSYAWLVNAPQVARRIAVEYQDTAGKVLASKYIDTRDCR